MKINYTRWSWIFLAASLPLAWMFLQRSSRRSPVPVVRVATFDVAMRRDAPGLLLEELRSGRSVQARAVAEIVQRNAVDVLLICGFDRDGDGSAVAVFADDYLAVGQGGQHGIEFPYRYCGAVNAGEPSGIDLDGDGSVDGPGDSWGPGAFAGQGGMAVLSRHPILADRVRTFRELHWDAMPGALRPDDCRDDETWRQLRLSSRSHWDVPIGLGPVSDGRVLHLLCSQPTSPMLEGEVDRNGRRNHDEVRFWCDYLTPERATWITDDDGGRGGLDPAASFVLAGDLGCDPVDGAARRDALLELLGHERVRDPAPRSPGAELAANQQWGSNSDQRGAVVHDTADLDDTPGTGPGNLRVDYVLPSRDLGEHGALVFWPLPHEAGADLVSASDHRLVWVDVGLPAAAR
ncbi:MAG: endonuclease/exonuclease/phosphatase family protein [Planctomycetes bacterium]|nr:endonuclease/exonuclease/phosphatase family protein [Planctomycetota bacterium]